MARVTRVKDDPSLPSLDNPGRFDGDMFAALSFQAMRDDKYCWRVETAEWVEVRYTAEGHARGLEDRDYWGEQSSILHEFPSKSFRTSEKAIKYLLKVRSAAEYEMIRRRLDTVTQGQSVRIA